MRCRLCSQSRALPGAPLPSQLPPACDQAVGLGLLTCGVGGGFEAEVLQEAQRLEMELGRGRGTGYSLGGPEQLGVGRAIVPVGSRPGPQEGGLSSSAGAAGKWPQGVVPAAELGPLVACPPHGSVGHQGPWSLRKATPGDMRQELAN